MRSSKSSWVLSNHKGLVSFIVFYLVFAGCSPTKTILKSLKETEAKFQDHTGFFLYDPSSKKTIISYNASRYFTPASNTKIFTFYTSLQLLGDSIPAIKYIQRNDSLIFWGMGDPSFLYQNVYQNDKIFRFLKESPQKLFISTASFQTEHLGHGWAWDDYPYSYSTERTPFPIYGNLIDVSVAANQLPKAKPVYFSKFITVSGEVHQEQEINREINSNKIDFYSGKNNKVKKWSIPFHYSPDLIADLLSDTLKKPISHVHLSIPTGAKILRSVPADSLYKVMMQDSDNFIAEQLLLQCAAIVSDTLKPEIAIGHATKKFLKDLPDKPQWVDGSGLSRFNLFTPRSIVVLWNKIYQKIPRERLFKLLAVGGKTGTLKNWYKAEEPYIYGKTGTLTNNHCLSGYLITKKGKTLIFSMMSNHFVDSGNDLRKQMEQILKKIHDTY